jgi:F0F1-type ATP synthase assembly protein I
MDDQGLGKIGKYTGLALLLPLATFVGFAIGYGLDHLFHTAFLSWIFLALGTVSGFIQLLRELQKDT